MTRLGRTIVLTICATAITLSGIIAFSGNSAHASLVGFDSGNIMDDAVMSSKNSMTVTQIQAFLDSKNACNDTAIHKAAWYPNLQYTIRDGKFVCMAKDTFNGKSAAQIIWQAAQDYSINPQVLIVLLEKEQGLISDTWPNHVQYRTATGFGCPDTAPCDAQYWGLENQVRLAAKLFREVLNGGWSNYPIGNNYIQYNPDKGCGGSIVNIKNRATSALYRYTPYQPNQAALAAGWGQAHCGAYGNRNFYNLFVIWFGSTRMDTVLPELVNRYSALGGPTGRLGKIVDNGYCDAGKTVCWQGFANGAIIWSPATGAWESTGGIRERWAQLGYQSGSLGFPVSGEVWDGKGWWQSYQNGAIIGTAKTGFWESMGPIRERWGAIGYQNSFIGYPKGKLVYTNNQTEAWQEYEKGYIFWSQQSGAWESKGDIRERWGQLGYQTGTLGYPTGAENWDGRGWWQSYQNGAIIGTVKTGFWESMGPIRERWDQLGYQTGTLGYPTGKIVYSSDKKSAWQQYENGYLYWQKDAGTWESKGAIRNYWAEMGYASGRAGAPIGPELYNSTTKTWSQSYQNGVIYYSDAQGGSYVQK